MSDTSIQMRSRSVFGRVPTSPLAHRNNNNSGLVVGVHVIQECIHLRTRSAQEGRSRRWPANRAPEGAQKPDAGERWACQSVTRNVIQQSAPPTQPVGRQIDDALIAGDNLEGRSELFEHALAIEG